MGGRTPAQPQRQVRPPCPCVQVPRAARGRIRMTLDAFSQHAPHPYFEARDGELVVAGRKISDIAAEVGRTPFYVYDRSVMSRKVAKLRAAVPREVHLHYAMKANPMPEVVRHFCGL